MTVTLQNPGKFNIESLCNLIMEFTYVTGKLKKGSESA